MVSHRGTHMEPARLTLFTNQKKGHTVKALPPTLTKFVHARFAGPPTGHVVDLELKN